MKLKSEIINIKKVTKGLQDCEWFTFKKGQEVPEELIKLAKQQGAEFEVKEVKKEEPVKKVVKKKNELDLNNDGKVDKKDRSLAAKVMGSVRKSKKSKK